MKRLTAALLCALLFPALCMAADYRDLDWLDLLTDEDHKAMLNLPELDHGNGVDTQRQGSPLRPLNADMPAVMYSAKVRPELDGQRISLTGFIVPLDTDKDNRVVELFLVPYQGACIHVPPPPPNQIVYIRYPKGIALDDMWSLFRFSGVLRTQHREDDVAESAYALEVEKLELNPPE